MTKRNLKHFANISICTLLGGSLGEIAHRLKTSTSADLWMAAGAAIGLVLGLTWPLLRSFALRHQLDDWRLEEVEFGGLKFTAAGAQRRVAWRLFVEVTTRIATQPMQDEAGHDGAALESLRKLFDFTRMTVSDMQLTPKATGETVETYALDMLNNDLRPFLSRWHPLWDDFAKSGQTGARPWPEHAAFRAGLREVQGKIQGRARGLAKIAGVQNVDRFFSKPPTNATSVGNP